MASIPQIISFDIEGGSPFGERTPKPKSIKAVKLTADNVHEVGKYVADKLGGGLWIDPGGRTLSAWQEDDPSNVAITAPYGSWIIERYSYGLERVDFRLARWDEREKYDLR